MPSYGIALIFCSNNYISTFTSFNYKLVILGITFIFTFLLPTINALILLKTGRINSLQMETSKERIIPYAGASLYHFALYYLFYNAQFPETFQLLILASAVSILITFLITLKWKISAHMVGIGGVAGGLLGIIYRLQTDLVLMLLISILASGIIGYARLKLNAHSPSQVYAGFALGFFVELILMILY